MVDKKVYFATNRKIAEPLKRPWFGEEKSGDGTPFRVGTATARLQGDEWVVTGVDVEPEAIPTSDELKSNFDAALAKKKIGSPILFEKYVKHLLLVTPGSVSNKAALVFLHGAAYDFVDTISDAAKLSQLYSDENLDLIPFTFSYPTNGKWNPLDYLDDRHDASVSGLAMARAMQRLIQFLARLGAENQCGCKIFLLAHSLGNYAMTAALQAMLKSSQMTTVRLFNSIFMMAADEDNDAFVRDSRLAKLHELAQEIHVYFKSDDKLVAMSDVIHKTRLGQTGPVPPVGPALGGARFNVVDCTLAKDQADATTKHRYYKLVPEVVEDVRRVLRGALPSSIPNRTWDQTRQCWVLADRK